jgi:hypothetical protein
MNPNNANDHYQQLTINNYERASQADEGLKATDQFYARAVD